MAFGDLGHTHAGLRRRAGFGEGRFRLPGAPRLFGRGRSRVAAGVELLVGRESELAGDAKKGKLSKEERIKFKIGVE